MKPKEKKPQIVCRIIDRDNGTAVGSYSRAYCDEYDFESVYEARRANCHGKFMDEEKFKIAKYKAMKTKFYFENEDATMCYNKEYFLDNMKSDGLTEMEVMEAIPDKNTNLFWCKCEAFCGEDTADSCGKQCNNYAPRNGKSGCCRYHSKLLYFHGDKVKLTP